MVVKQRVPEALLVFLVPAVARGPVPAPPLARHRDRRRARDPAAQRRHRARAPGRLRPRRGQRDRRGRADGRGDRGDHRAGEAPQRGPADPRRLRGARCRPRSAWISAEPSPAPVDGRLVEVAVDAPAGPGPRTYTYLAPAGSRRTSSRARRCSCRSAAAVARRSASWSARARRPRRGGVRPIAARVRSDGPLLPPLSLAFAAELAARYLAPLAVVIRAMLPPGMLERLELMAEVTPAGEARMGLAEPGAAAARARPARRAGRAGPRRCATSRAPRAGPRCCGGCARSPTRASSS